MAVALPDRPGRHRYHVARTATPHDSWATLEPCAAVNVVSRPHLMPHRMLLNRPCEVPTDDEYINAYVPTCKVPEISPIHKERSTRWCSLPPQCLPWSAPRATAGQAWSLYRERPHDTCTTFPLVPTRLHGRISAVVVRMGRSWRLQVAPS